MSKIKGRLNFKLPMQGKKILQNRWAEYLVNLQVGQAFIVWNIARVNASEATKKLKENPKDSSLREANKAAHINCLNAKRTLYAWRAISNNLHNFIETFGTEDMFLEDTVSVAKWQLTRIDVVNSLMGRPTYKDHQKFSDMLVSLDKRLTRIENNFDDGK